MQALYFYESPIIGRYAVRETDQQLTQVYVGDRLPTIVEETEIYETPLLREASFQLTAYFAKKLRTFHLPLAPRGTTFQLKIWKLLQDIPYGETITYGELARQTGDLKACRAVGMANSRNPLSILIPCHRVIGAGGKLTGYTGGLGIKIKLLEIENISVYP